MQSPELFPSMYSGSEELSAADLSPEIPLVGSRPCRGSTSTGRRSGIGRRQLSFSSSGGGDSPDRSGDIEDRRRSGDVEDRRCSGDVENISKIVNVLVTSKIVDIRVISPIVDVLYLMQQILFLFRHSLSLMR